MYKKVIFAFSFLLVAVFGLTGCTAVDNDVKVNENEPKESMLPVEQSDLYGLVKSITGNEVKIMLLERKTVETTQDDSGDAAASIAPTTSTGSGGGGGMGGGSGSGGAGGTGDPADRIAMLKSKSIGEITVLVPVGIEMFKSVKNVDVDTGRVVDEATFSDMGVEKIVNIWLNSDIEDRQVAEVVSIIEF